VDIDFEQDVVYVDGIALHEPYVSSSMSYLGVDFPLVVDEGCLFVMGDNRFISEDSRSPKIGLIDRREVLGKAILLFMPGTDKGKTVRDFSRLGVLSNGTR
jgi:signal peptidase I